MPPAPRHATTPVLRWAVIAPFITPDESRWLAPFVNSSRHRLEAVQPGHSYASWHAKAKGVTGLAEWVNYQRYAGRAWKTKPDGIITVFPQLAIAAGLRKRLSGSRLPVVAWCLNLGKLPTGPKRSLARFALGQVDRFVVHARRECDHYSAGFGLPRERFEFVPLQRGYLEPTHPEERGRPFLLAMGSAHRDFRTLFEAIRPLNLRTVIVTSPRCLDGLSVPESVEVRSGVSRDECLVLAQQARLNVVPIANDETASGQVTVVEAMWLGRPVVATRCLGTEDYIDSGTDGYLVARQDAGQLRQAIELLWEDAAMRERIGSAARARAMTQYSDEMAGAALTRILDQVTANG